MSGVLRWEQPGDHRTTRGEAEAARWKPVADELRARARQGAVILEGDTQEFNRVIAYVRSGRGPFGPAKAFEARQRTWQDREARGQRSGRLYARYVGGGAS